MFPLQIFSELDSNQGLLVSMNPFRSHIEGGVSDGVGSHGMYFVGCCVATLLAWVFLAVLMGARRSKLHNCDGVVLNLSLGAFRPYGVP